LHWKKFKGLSFLAPSIR